MNDVSLFYVHLQTICHILFCSKDKAWNSLPNDICKITDTNAFKCHLKFYFFLLFLHIGLGYGSVSYVMFYVKSVIR